MNFIKNNIVIDGHSLNVLNKYIFSAYSYIRAYDFMNCCYLCILPVILTSYLSSCNQPEYDNIRLNEISSLIEYNPNAALDSLNKIDYALLTKDSDRHFFDLLSIKAADKAFIIHNSDSLILDVIDYYSSNKSESLTPEALYYGGRVYSDIGDYPTALKYFQSALDLLPQDTKNQSLRACVLSQTGRLLNSLRLYSLAIPYIEACIETDKYLKDTINEVYDLQLLGTTYLRSHIYDSAENSFRDALSKSDNLSTHVKAKSKMYLAAVKHKKNQNDSALIYIRNIPNLVDSIARNSALAYATEIYLESGILDTAYIYANELVSSKDFTNKKTGYLALLSKELQSIINADSLRVYAYNYGLSLEKYLDENENQLALNQQSLYNYQLHERIKDKEQQRNKILIIIVIASGGILLILGIVILFLKNKNKSHLIKLHSALENLERLQISLSEKDSCLVCATSDKSYYPYSGKESLQELRIRLREDLYNLYVNNANVSTVLDPKIIKSEAYHRLQKYINDGLLLKDHDPLWNELEKIVLACSPKFKEHLQLLVGGKLNSYDLQTSILIKCGVSPTHMSSLLNRTKGTIASRRESICARVFDEKLGTKVIDGIIRLL